MTPMIYLMVLLMIAPMWRPDGPGSRYTVAAATVQQADPGIAATRVLGEVTSIDQGGKQMTVKTDAGSVVTVMLDEKTEYLRVPPGETSVDKAVKISFSDVSVGDKIYARGRVSEDHKSVPAQRLVVMSASDIQKRHEQERVDWQKRGVSGLVTAINPDTKEVTIQTRGRQGLKSIAISVPATATFRRYAPDSVKFSDAKPSSFAELKVGDQVRALGTRNEEGTQLAAEQIVSGSFKTIGGTVSAINPATGEIKMTMLGTKQAFTVVVNKDSLLRRIPPQLGAMLAQRSQAMAGGDAAGGAARPAGPPAAGGPGGDRPRPQGGGDFQDMLERMPALTLAEIKPGDVIAVSSTFGADPSRLTAITLVDGVDTILNAMQAAGAPRRAPNLSTGLPSGVLDLGIGQP